MAYQVACQSVTVFEQLGLTGRVFANNKRALAVVEGPTAIVEQYFHALSSDILLETIFLHSSRNIDQREGAANFAFNQAEDHGNRLFK